MPLWCYLLLLSKLKGIFMRKFDIVKLDWEERCGIASIGNTAVRKVSSLALGIAFTAFFYGILSLLRARWSGVTTIEMFFSGGAAGRSFIPVITVLVAMWTLSMLLLKRSKLKLQRAALRAVPENLTVENYRSKLEEIYDTPEDFICCAATIKRMELKERKLNTVETNSVMESYFNDLEKESENTFMPVSCFIWSIPVLGFIGTVLGLARAVSNFGALSGAGDNAGFNQVLPQITGGLATAFETTLIALVLALLLQVISSFQNQGEMDFIAQVKNKVMSEPPATAENSSEKTDTPENDQQ